MNRALRRLVHREEEAQREKRQRLQRIAKQRLVEVATATAAAAAVASAPLEAATPENKDTAQLTQPPTTINATSNAEDAGQEDAIGDEYEVDDDVIEQQKLLASATAHWKCVEDSQQAVCIAMNRRQTLFAVGEKDGRVSIWDNTTIRVITKELDPTSIVIPEELKPEATETAESQVQVEPDAKRQKTEDDATEVPVIAAPQDELPANDQDGSADGDSATNDDGSVDANEDGSVTNDDASVEEADEAMDEDDSASVEGNASVDDNETVEEPIEDEDTATGDSVMADVDEETAVSAVDTHLTTPVPIPRETLDGGVALTIEELKIAKSSLKHVTCLAWSCDSRLLIAGCEEKSNRRGRLCVWDAESAWLLATFSFDAAINCVSAHPTNPDLIIVCWYNSLPVLLNIRTREMIKIAVPITNTTLTVTLPPNSRHPSLIVCARFGGSGRFIYCATSKSTVSVLDGTTLQSIDTKLLPILIQFVDLAINIQETALAFTSSKGIHEYAIKTENGPESQPQLEETRLFATGAVRAPWALCCFSSDEGYVVGMPIVRHRHVGESGLYTWNRATGRVQHNLGVKDGVNSVAWDLRRDAVAVVSCIGALHVLEEEFATSWPGTMYPAGFRLVTDNEADLDALEQELQEKEKAAVSHGDIAHPADAADGEADAAIDVFTMPDPEDPFEKYLPPVRNEVRYLPSIPIALPHKRNLHHHDFHVERHFGLGQSVFEPLKSAIKKPSTSSSSKKSKSKSKSKSSTRQNAEMADGATATPNAAPSRSSSSKSKSKSKSRSRSGGGSSKKRRR